MKPYFLKLFITAGVASLMAACGGGGDSAPATVTQQQQPTLAQTASANPELSSLMATVQYVDQGSNEKLMPKLSEAGSTTIFAPNNEAFDKLAEEILGAGSKAADLLKPELKDDLRDILKYQMLSGNTVKSDMKSGQTVNTMLANTSFKMEELEELTYITDSIGRPSLMSVTDILASNGVLHIIDTVILPPKFIKFIAKNSIVGVASKTPALSSLVAALKFASIDNDLVNLLSTRKTLQGFTVFAPTNDAFDALAVEILGAGKTAADLLVPANKDLVRAVLQYHVLNKFLPKAFIRLGKPIDPVLEGKDIFKIDKVNGKLVINDGRNRKSNIVKTDIWTTTGIVHIIDKVILPADKNIVETAIALKPEFSVLVEAVVAAGLTETLSKPGPYTVFAPTNQAFVDLLGELKITKAALLADKALLTAVLTYHVLPAQVLKAQVPVGKPISPLLAGQTFQVDKDFKITDANGRTSQIIATDVLTKNGVIHVIDKVILPK